MTYPDRPSTSRFGTELLGDVMDAARTRAGAQAWRSRIAGMWHHVGPPGDPDRCQGWKLHVSATPLSAPLVLAQAAPVLLEHGCAFKFAATLDRVAELTDGRCERSQGGKFLTAYPRDDEHLRTLAEALDQETRGLPGPPVLSDRPYRPGSLVFYRYGAFLGVEVLTDDGTFEARLRTPAGGTVTDQRNAWYSPPAWAVPPFPVPGREPVGSGTEAKPGRSASKRIGGRFTVRRALRHAYRGGVFVALDEENGAEVILKQARPHVGSWFTGTDLRDSLRYEAEVLGRLPGVAPRPIGLFTHEDNLFLAEEFITGETLSSWVGRRRQAEGNRGLSVAEAAGTVGGLVEPLAAVHGEGLVHRDVNPNNVMVTPDGSLRLIDFEHATVPGTPVRWAMTTGYAAPEQIRGPVLGPAPGFATDLYSLGAIVFYLVTGTHPLGLPDDPDERPPGERLMALLGTVGPHEPAAACFTDLVAALTAETPGDRWSLPRVRDFLAEAVAAQPARILPAPAAASGGATPEGLLQRALDDGLTHLMDTMAPDGPRLWPDSGFAATTDPCSVQHGAGGVLGVLVRAATTPRDPITAEHVRTVADWIVDRLPSVPRTLPGLFFGASGTAWALHSAARLLDDAAMERRALDLARSVPVDWPNPDVCHGLAGAGLTLVHLWRATGDSVVEARAHACADAVVKAAVQDGRGPVWEIPSSSDSALAGTTAYGFAHGTAGVGAYLLAMGCASGRGDCLELSAEAWRTLVDAMQEVDESACWPVRPDGSEPNRMPWSWCNGSAGIGAFLARLWQVTGDEQTLRAAERAGVAAHRDRWNPSGSVCHGAPGSGQLLLDLAEATGEQQHRDRAGELAACLVGRHGVREGRILVADETGVDYAAGYHTGLAGTLDFLLRLRDGGPRLWMPDEILTRATRAPERGPR